MSASASTLYSTIPTDLSSVYFNNSSEPLYAAGEIAFGALIQPIVGGPMNGATVALSSYGTAAQYDSQNASFDLTITLSLYNVGAQTSAGTLDPIDSSYNGDATYLAGNFIASAATTATFNFSPDGSGVVSLVNFGFAPVELPSSFIYAISYDTTSGPGQSLNVIYEGISPQDPSAPAGANIGIFPNFDTAYVDTGSGLTAQTGYASYGSAAVSFSDSAAPEPATFGLIGLGLVGLGIAARKKGKI